LCGRGKDLKAAGPIELRCPCGYQVVDAPARKPTGGLEGFGSLYAQARSQKLVGAATSHLL
jgi:hypothetical protein